ncbi:hypothetical protein BV898_08791 [Hypsibius exemplaris]|uniref:Uncharacterized protein n=1 Tax=Hypsibius exemplaris TaxID=2072580 RepID=A0A1W0WPE5_HYPEX|nr:hypothetical protein BV898_08791 [Hypsibius exemplaris]
MQVILSFQRVSSRSAVAAMLVVAWVPVPVYLAALSPSSVGMVRTIVNHQCAFTPTRITPAMAIVLLSLYTPELFLAICMFVIARKARQVNREDRRQALARLRGSSGNTNGQSHLAILTFTARRRTHVRRMEVATMLGACFGLGVLTGLPFCVLSFAFPGYLHRTPLANLWPTFLLHVGWTFDPVSVRLIADVW